MWTRPASVVVPDALAGPVRDLLVTGLWDLAKTNGGTVLPELQRLIEQLHQADQHRAQAAAVPVPEPPTATSPIVEVSTVDAAHAMGCSVEYVRRLARTGRIAARRAGQRTWLITIEEERAHAQERD